MDVLARDPMAAALTEARDALHLLCLERGSTDGYGYLFGKINAALATDRGAVSILRDLLDPDPCWYDHHGYCQAHSLHERPCPHERARDLLWGR